MKHCARRWRMKLIIEPGKIDWWFWTIISVLILTALLGWVPGYYLVMAVSALQVVYFTARHKSLTAFDTQVRIVYFALTLLGLSQTIRFPFYILLLPGTLMAVFFDRCSIALALKCMPWNKECLVKVQSKDTSGTPGS
jgi:hypothetical protein